VETVDEAARDFLSGKEFGMPYP